MDPFKSILKFYQKNNMSEAADALKHELGKRKNNFRNKRSCYFQQWIKKASKFYLIKEGLINKAITDSTTKKSKEPRKEQQKNSKPVKLLVFVF